MRSASTHSKGNSPTGSALEYHTAAEFARKADDKAPKPKIDVRGKC